MVKIIISEFGLLPSTGGSLCKNIYDTWPAAHLPGSAKGKPGLGWDENTVILLGCTAALLMLLLGKSRCSMQGMLKDALIQVAGSALPIPVTSCDLRISVLYP
jgi:hypothetical protein